MQNDHRCSCQQETKSRSLFGRITRITVLGKGQLCSSKIITQAFDVMERLEALTDCSHLNSELMKLTANPVNQYVEVSSWLWHLLQTANDISYRTDGAFDIVAAGTDGVAEWTDLDLSKPRMVRLRRPVYLSVGGLRKGYAVDLAVKALRELGAGAGLIDAGGCIRTFGPREWRIEFKPNALNPCGENEVVPVSLYDSSLVGLGHYFGGAKIYDRDNQMVRCAREWQKTSLLVRANSCAHADALTKVAALKPQESPKMLKQFGASAFTMSEFGVGALNYSS